MSKQSISDFPYITVSVRALAKRTSLFGVGINDADYRVCVEIKGKQVKCPIYQKWKDMFTRCYSPRFHINNPTYAGCSVDPAWFSFMAFRAWVVKQDWIGKEIDKDLLTPGNKVYSPNTCLFVPPAINRLFLSRKKLRGQHPVGVTLPKTGGKFVASISINGKSKGLGRFDTAKEASSAYKKAKHNYVIYKACQQTDPLRGALIAYAESMV